MFRNSKVIFKKNFSYFLFLNKKSLKNLVKTFEVLNFNELPKKGDLVGIDTECITLNNSSILRFHKIKIN